MNANQEIENQEEFREEPPLDDNAISVEDFIRELEEKEKDLHISPDLSIEVEEADFDDQNIPDFLADDLHKNKQQAARQLTQRKPQIAAGASKSEMDDLKGQIADLEAERKHILEKSQKRLKEFENFKNRMERERRETFVSQISNLATMMLPVLDNLDRAINFAADLPAAKRDELYLFFEGIELVNQQVNEILVGMGVQRIASVGEQFDPHLHEAVATHEDATMPRNSISEELLRGYRIGEKVIRHSMVKVVTESGVRMGDLKNEQEEGHFTPVLDLPEMFESNQATDTPMKADAEVEDFIAQAYAGPNEPDAVE